MESLTYLYVLAEDATDQAKSDAGSAKLRPTKQQRAPQPMLWDAHATDGQHWLDDDCDRTNPSYPTFYL